jgi:hypothetical protein
MGAYKPFLASDIVITPLELNKSFNFKGAAALTASNAGIDRFLGLNTSSLFNPLTDPTTGQISPQYQRLVYSSIKELYYSNYLNSTASLGSPVTTASLVPGSDVAGNVLVGPTSSAGRYWNYPQTDLIFEHYYPTSSNSYIGVLSVPVGLFGNYIQPGSFIWSADSGSIYDDGEGNLILSSSQKICGQIFYPHGLAIITSNSSPGSSNLYGSAIFGYSLYGNFTDEQVIKNFVTSSNVTCSFSSSLTIYETQYKCTLNENEFNFSQNPSIISGSEGEPYGYVTSSYFSPYVTTVGLYDENQNLLAVGKLSQPLPTSATTDTTILVNIDR